MKTCCIIMIVPLRAEQSHMRSWRNWQTRKTKDLVFPRHAGSSPVDRTITVETELNGSVFL